MECKAGGEFGEVEGGGCAFDLFGEALDVVVALLDLGPVGPLEPEPIGPGAGLDPGLIGGGALQP